VKYLHDFDFSDGSAPSAALIAANNTLWGVTPYGGTNSTGTLFSLDPATGVLTTVHAFDYTTEGKWPAALIDFNGLFIGTLTQGDIGQGKEGTIFSFDPSTGVEKTLYAFTNSEAGGGMPYGPIIIAGGTLYGTCLSGGEGDDGAGDIFALDLASGSFKILYQFPSVANGSTILNGGLVALKGALYGTTSVGGQYNSGTVFKLEIKTGNLTTLHNFNFGGSDGYDPQTGLTVYNGLLYGTTSLGGLYNGNTAGGIIFSIDPSSGAETIVYTVPEPSSAGKDPSAPLAVYKGSLFGTYYAGGTHEFGTVTKLSP
jgi:uncharacterized repeat protein (TIGR03803 family)